MSVYFFAWTASIFFGFESIFAKLVSKHTVSNPWMLNFFWMLFTLIFTIPVALYMGARFPVQWFPLLLTSLFFALANTLYTKALFKIDVSVMSPLWNFRTAMTVILGAVLLNEVLTTHQYFLILIIFIFGIFVNLDEKFSIKSFFTKDIFLALLSMLAFTFEYIFINNSVTVNGYWNTVLWGPLLGQLWLLATIPFFKKDILNTNLKQYGSIILLSIFGFIGVLAATAAYSKNLSISAAIISLPVSMVIAFLFSVFAPQLLEKHNLKVYLLRFISAGIMIIAALNL